MPDIKTLSPADLLIDPANPRLPNPHIGQREALRELARHLDRKILRLASDIVTHGVNPSDLPIVTSAADDTQRYVVLEGNRRLAALRLLENPEPMVGVADKAVLEEMRRLSRAYQSNPVESIHCLVVKDRDEANHWIELRHTGENEGAGIVRWGSDEAARYRARSGDYEIQTQALNLLESRGDLTPEDRRKVPATSLRRMLNTKEVREKLGIEFEDRQLRILADEDKVAHALMYLVTRLKSGEINVNAIRHKEDRIRLAQQLPSTVAVTPTKEKGKGVAPKGAKAPPQPKPPAKAKPRARDNLIPGDCVLKIDDARIRDIEIELRGLSLASYVNAVSVLFRVFLELSVDAYITKRALAASRDERLTSKMEAVLENLLDQKRLTKSQATPVRRACQRDSFLAPSVQMMHQYVHNQYVFPAESDLRAYWDGLQPFITAIWSL